jgi:hypothetical protein
VTSRFSPRCARRSRLQVCSCSHAGGAAADLPRGQPCLTGSMHTTAVTVYGICALTFMMAMYAFERRHRRFVLAFALGCLLSSAYGFLAGAWPFGVVEVVWAGLALLRFLRRSREAPA